MPQSLIIKKLLVFATDICEEMLLATSTHQIILFKYAKVYRVNYILLDRSVGFRQCKDPEIVKS